MPNEKAEGLSREEFEKWVREAGWTELAFDICEDDPETYEVPRHQMLWECAQHFWKAASSIKQAQPHESEPYMHEDELPADMPRPDYFAWYAKSWVPDGGGVRVGPIYPPKLEGKQAEPPSQPAQDGPLGTCWLLAAGHGEAHTQKVGCSKWKAVPVAKSPSQTSTQPPEFAELKEFKRLRYLAQMVVEAPCFTNAILAVTEAYQEGWQDSGAKQSESISQATKEEWARRIVELFQPKYKFTALKEVLALMTNEGKI